MTAPVRRKNSLGRFLPISVLVVLGGFWAWGQIFGYESALAQSAGRALVIVHQVEGPEAAGQNAYAAVAGGQSNKRLIPENAVKHERVFSDIEFVWLSGPNSTPPAKASAHAAAVGASIFGKESVAAGRVGRVYAQGMMQFLTGLKAVSKEIPFSQPPDAFPAGTVVSNHSWVNTMGGPEVDGEIIRRADFAAHRDNVVLVAGAVAGGRFGATSLMWSCFNGLAVAGDDQLTPFDPAAGKLGRQHADVWFPGKASFATARASSIIARLSSLAREKNLNDATRAVVLRAMVLAAAEKTGHPKSPDKWPRLLPNHMSPTQGAGRMSSTRAEEILNSRQILPSEPDTVTGAIMGTPQLQRTGWSRLLLENNQTRAVLFELTEASPRLSAALTYDVRQPARQLGANWVMDSRAGSRYVPKVKLELRRLTIGKGGLQMQPVPVSDNRWVSSWEASNLQHLYIDTPLEPGRYALLVNGDENIATELGLAFYADPVVVTPVATSGPAPVENKQ